MSLRSVFIGTYLGNEPVPKEGTYPAKILGNIFSERQPFSSLELIYDESGNLVDAKVLPATNF